MKNYVEAIGIDAHIHHKVVHRVFSNIVSPVKA